MGGEGRGSEAGFDCETGDGLGADGVVRGSAGEADGGRIGAGHAVVDDGGGEDSGSLERDVGRKDDRGRDEVSSGVELKDYRGGVAIGPVEVGDCIQECGSACVGI